MPRPEQGQAGDTRTTPVDWYVVLADPLPGRPASRSVYDGPSRDQAEAAHVAAARAGRTGLRRHHVSRYPPPERNPLCVCKSAPQRQALCAFGHRTECHYPHYCHEALCYHNALEERRRLAAFFGRRPAAPEAYDQAARLRQAGPRPLAAMAALGVTVDREKDGPEGRGGQVASWLAQAVAPADRVFSDSPDAGDPRCLCSRCLRPIGEDDCPVRVWPEGPAAAGAAGPELRYHAQCLGLPTPPAGERQGRPGP